MPGTLQLWTSWSWITSALAERWPFRNLSPVTLFRKITLPSWHDSSTNKDDPNVSPWQKLVPSTTHTGLSTKVLKPIRTVNKWLILTVVSSWGQPCHQSRPWRSWARTSWPRCRGSTGSHTAYTLCLGRCRLQLTSHLTPSGARRLL